MRIRPGGGVFARVFFGASLALCAAPVGAHAQCQSADANPSITLEVAMPPVRYQLNEATETLSARARESGTALDRGSRLLGLTVNDYDLGIAVELHRERVAGGWCVALQHGTVTAAPDVEVLVDERFKVGTCQQRAIIDHENEHVAVFREALAYYQPAMKDALRRAQLDPLFVAADRDAESEYAAMIRDVLAPVLDAVRQRTHDANSRIDTAQHYAAVFRRCSSWD